VGDSSKRGIDYKVVSFFDYSLIESIRGFPEIIKREDAIK